MQTWKLIRGKGRIEMSVECHVGAANPFFLETESGEIIALRVRRENPYGDHRVIFELLREGEDA